ncbi:hypothetical protein Patl1_04059 [Pistacia atlantica]|uniref:Uncharacterized protein n=1 Tax=Pistacia atlantica TaxID=434234 RepID=A0ACC1BWN6_9ROSI|nr:hypothetical protein Patl1_04059 [Pistacia atlantica]
MDKERHHATIENKESQPKQTDVALNSEETQSSTMFSSNSDMPEFHISVFQDLASVDVSLRQAAVESLVTELEEVQKDYERCGKELVENGIKLEADKDVGLNDCAPSSLLVWARDFWVFGFACLYRPFIQFFIANTSDSIDMEVKMEEKEDDEDDIVVIDVDDEDGVENDGDEDYITEEEAEEEDTKEEEAEAEEVTIWKRRGKKTSGNNAVCYWNHVKKDDVCICEILLKEGEKQDIIKFVLMKKKKNFLMMKKLKDIML